MGVQLLLRTNYVDSMKRIIEYIYSKFISVQIFLIRFIFGLIFNFRLIGLGSLVFIAVVSLFRWNGAELTNNVLIVCGLIFLASVFEDIQKWNLWGFAGEKKNLYDIPQGNSVSKDAQRPSPEEVSKEENKPLQFMPNEEGNFLKLAFEIERLLRIMTSVTELKDIHPTVNIKQVVNQLNSKGIITDQGKAQIEAILWLRNLLVHGRGNEINEKALVDGTSLAFSLYTEIHNWLNPQNEK